MKTARPASAIWRFLVLSWAFVFALPLSAVTNTYTQPPPPGYPASGPLTKQPSTRATRQSAAAIQAPITRPQYPSTYPPPAGYTYPPAPPGYGPPPNTSAKKSTTAGKSGSKTGTTKKPAAGPPPPPKVYGPTGDLSTQVEKLRDSDKVQNIRIGALERDVSSIKRGGKSTTRYDGGTDLAAHTTYIARPGDTLWRIASTHRVSVGEIQQLNRMTEEEVHVGQTLLIPSPHRLDSAATIPASYTPPTIGGSPSAPVSTVKVSAPVYHTVKKGDSLKAIALKHKITIAALASANKIKDTNKIVVGQRLKIPGRTTTVTVASKSAPPSAQQSSDTIPLAGSGVPGAPPSPASGLAPAPAPASAAPPAPAPSTASAPKIPDTSDSHRGILAYRVDSADSIESIATQFTTTPEQIREMNRLPAGTTLKPGDEIMVPAMGAVSVSSR